MELQRGELSSLSGSIKIFKVRWPHRLNKYNSYFRGIKWAGRSISAQKEKRQDGVDFYVGYLKKSSFSTMERVLTRGQTWTNS